MTGTQNLNDLAGRIHRIYIRERRIFEERLTQKPSKYLLSPFWDEDITKQQNVWKRLAEFLFEEHLEVLPDDFVQRVFDMWDPLKAPLPNQLMSRMATELYDRSDQFQLHLARQSLLSQSAHLKNRVPDCQLSPTEAGDVFAILRDEERTLASILLDESEDLDPLFRFCMAEIAGLEDVKDVFRSQAAWEYWRHREEYDAAWGKVIPGPFRETAEGIYRDILVQKGLDDDSLQQEVEKSLARRCRQRRASDKKKSDLMLNFQRLVKLEPRLADLEADVLQGYADEADQEIWDNELCPRLASLVGCSSGQPAGSILSSSDAFSVAHEHLFLYWEIGPPPLPAPAAGEDYERK